MIGMIFIIYQGIVVPYRICFSTPANGELAVFELIQDFFFIIDIVITANTCYYEKGNIVSIRSKIVLQYLKLWFWLDLSASIPYSMLIDVDDYFDINNTPRENNINSKAPQILRILKFMRFMRILRLIRVMKLKSLLIRFEDFFMSDFFNLMLQFIKLLFVVFFISHWGACFWYFIGINEQTQYGISWLSAVKILDKPYMEQYINAIYYFITTMTTVGYGDIVPITTNEKIFSMFSMIIACGVFAYVIGSVGSVLSNKYDSEIVFKQKIMWINQYLVNKNIKKSLRTKVRRYLEHVLDNKKEKKIDEQEFLQMLNKNLKEEVIMHLNGLLLKHKTFSVINKYDEFCILLTTVMREDMLNPGDVIFHKGDLSLRTYFITSGIVSIFDYDTKLIYKELDKSNNNNFFGEVGFFSGKKRVASAETITFSSLTYISIESFKEAAYRFLQLNPEKFKIFEKDLNELRVSIRRGNFSGMYLNCYLCNDNSHLSPNCLKLRNIDEVKKLKIKDKRIKKKSDFMKHYENVVQIYSNGRVSANYIIPKTTQFYRRESTIERASFSKNTHERFFSYESDNVEEEKYEENGMELKIIEDSLNDYKSPTIRKQSFELNEENIESSSISLVGQLNINKSSSKSSSVDNDSIVIQNNIHMFSNNNSQHNNEYLILKNNMSPNRSVKLEDNKF
jgi:CRP-like cAMP-binding protein